MPGSPPTSTRRRGAELETALLAAAWDELVASGYSRLTMQTVAVRAGTSEPVLYRRWANKDALVLAALEHQRASRPLTPADTGGLRTDLLAELTTASETLAGVFAIVAAASMSGLMADSGLTPRQVRERVMGGPAAERERDARAARDVRPLYRRAAERGELDLARVPAAVLEMPFELLRLDLLLDLSPVPEARIRVIIDDLFLPLVASYLGTPAGEASRG